MKANNYTIRFLILMACLVIIDVIIKAIVVNHFQPTQTAYVVEGHVIVGRIQNLSMAFGFRGGFTWIDVVRVIIHVLMVWLAVRIQQRPVSKGYKYGSAMIAGGIIGGYIDWLLFSGGTPGYRSMDYIAIHPIEGMHSISSVLGTVGWVILIISIIISFKDLKVIFSRTFL